MPFAIRLSPEPVGDPDSHAEGRIGEILIDDYREIFLSPIGYWTPDQYTSQWRAAIAGLLDRGQPAALITSVWYPAQGDLVRWWLLYPRGEDTIAIHEAFLILPDQDREFTPDEPQSFIPAYQQLTEDGEIISEWVIRRQDLIDFLGTEKPSAQGGI